MKVCLAVVCVGQAYLVSSREMVRKIRKSEQLDAVLCYIHDDGMWYAGEKLMQNENLILTLSRLHPVRIEKKEFRFCFVGKRNREEFDVAVFVSDRPVSQDLIGHLQYYGIPVLGSTLESETVVSNQLFMKQILAANKVPMAPWTSLNLGHLQEDEKEHLRKVKRMGYPVWVKATTYNPSFTEVRVTDGEALKTVLLQASLTQSDVIVEKEISGIRTFDTVYLKAGQTEKAGAITEDVSRVEPPSEQWLKQIRVLTIEACRALRMEGVCKVRFFVNPENDAVMVERMETHPEQYGYPFFQEDLTWEEYLETLLSGKANQQRNRKPNAYRLMEFTDKRKE